MPYVVAKPFKTAYRRFPKDMLITRADITQSAMSWEDYVGEGYIVETGPAPTAAVSDEIHEVPSSVPPVNGERSGSL